MLFLFLNQRTPLHVAASKGHDYTVECLVEKGANINIKDKDGVGMSIFLNYYRQHQILSLLVLFDLGNRLLDQFLCPTANNNVLLWLEKK